MDGLQLIKKMGELGLMGLPYGTEYGGAGLDVFTVEPIPGDDPYLKLDNVILTPHVASSTVESLWQIYESAIDIADHFFRGEPDKRMLN